MEGLIEAKRAILKGRIVSGKIKDENKWLRVFTIVRMRGCYYGVGYDGVQWPITHVRIEPEDPLARPPSTI